MSDFNETSDKMPRKRLSWHKLNIILDNLHLFTLTPMQTVSLDVAVVKIIQYTCDICIKF